MASEINIGVGADTTKAQKGFKDLANSLNSIGKNLARLQSKNSKSIFGQWANATKDLDKAQKKLSEITEAYNNMSESNRDKLTINTEKLDIKIDASKKKIQSFKDEYDKIKEALADRNNILNYDGGFTNSHSQDSFNSILKTASEIQDRFQKIKEYADAVKEKNITLAKFNTNPTQKNFETAYAAEERYRGLEKPIYQIEELNKQQDKLRDKASAILENELIKLDRLVPKEKERLEYIKLQKDQLEEQSAYTQYQIDKKYNAKAIPLQGTISDEKELVGLRKADVILKAISKTLSTLAVVAQKVSKVFKSLGSKLFKAATASARNFEKSVSRVSHVLRYMILRMAFRAIIKNFQTDFKALTKVSDTLYESFNKLYNAVLKLGASFTSAVGPIVQFLGPALTYLANTMSNLLTLFGKFNAVLLNNANFFAQAKDRAEEYGKEASGAANKALAPFDQINKLSNGSGGGANETNPNDIFEEVPIEQSIKDFVQRIKDSFSTGDMSWLGETIGTSLNEALEKSLELSAKVKEKAKLLASSIATALNGFFETNDGKSLGTAIGDWINVGIEYCYTYVKTFNWTEFGQWLGGLIAGSLETIDWEQFGETIGTAVRGLIIVIYESLIENMPLIIEKLKDFIAGFWKALWEPTEGEKEVEGATKKINLFTAAILIAWGVIKGINIATWVTSNWAVLSAIFVKLATWISAIIGFVTTLGQVVFDILFAITGAIAAFLGIPVWAAGLIIAAVAAIVTAVVVYWDEICDYCSYAWNVIKQWWSDNVAVYFTKQWWTTLFSNIGNAILNFFYDLGEKIINAWEEIKSLFTAEKWKEIGDNITEGFMNGLKELPDKFLQPFKNGWESVKNFFGIHSPSTAFAELGGYMVEGLNNGLEDTEINSSPITSLYGNLEGGTEKLVNSMIEFWNEYTNELEVIFEGIRKMVQLEVTFTVSAINKMIDAMEHGMNQAINAMNMAISAYNSAASSTGGPYLSYLSGVTLSNIAIPKLAQGAVIPPNKEFMAVLGDQKHGTNIETPLDTMIEAFTTALNGMQSNQTTPINFNMDGKTFARAMAKLNAGETRRVGMKFVN